MPVTATNVNLRNVIIGSASVPIITVFSPTSGTAGNSIIITGINLLGTTTVRINGIPSLSLTNITSTSVTAVIPAGATTGVISVVTPGGVANTSGLLPSVLTVF